MTPYTGPWTSAEAAHLLRRCTFGASYLDIQNAVGVGMLGAVNQDKLGCLQFTLPTQQPISKRKVPA